MYKTYLELSEKDSYEERLEYLKQNGKVGFDTFGFDRFLNQTLYKSKEWKDVRNRVILRDKGCDMGIEGREIHDKIIVHHINSLTSYDIINRDPKIFDLNNLICVSMATHNAIHYGKNTEKIDVCYDRKKGDTKLW